MCQTVIEQHRNSLHEILCKIDGVKKVYFQPPSNRELLYPCIIYEFNDLDSRYANNKRYLSWPKYTLTLIDHDPESIIQKRIMDLQENIHVTFDRFFTYDNLNHWIYSIYYIKNIW